MSKGDCTVLNDHPEEKIFSGRHIIEMLDAHGHGGAHHHYKICDRHERVLQVISFQCGTIREAGDNGATCEDVLNICLDRLRHFQNGPYPSPQNEQAEGFIHRALQLLVERTADRMARGVEGEHKI